MLIMTRRSGESIRIGDRIVLRIMEVKGDRVQLGIDAPKDEKVTVVEPEKHPE